MPTFSYIYSIPYVIVFLLLFFCFSLERQNKTRQLGRNICLGILIIFLVFRGHLFTDYSFYYKMYTADLDNYDEAEYGFIYYMKFFKSLNLNFNEFRVISSFIDIICFHYIFRKRLKFVTLGWIMFFVFYGLELEINFMRNIKSVILFLFSLEFIKQNHSSFLSKIVKETLPYFVLNLLGLTFHTTSIVFLLFYFFINITIPRKLYLSLGVASFVLFILHITFAETLLTMFIEYYTDSRTTSHIMEYIGMQDARFLSIGVLERVFTFICITFFYDSLNKNPYIGVFVKLYLLYFVSSLLLSDLYTVVARFETLFSPSYWMVYPTILICQKSKTNFYVLLIMVYGCLKLATHLNNIYSDYDNMLTGAKSVQERERIMERHSSKINQKK